MWPYMGSMGWWMLLWWALAIVALILVARLAFGTAGSSAPRPEQSPEQILKRRYATGEIDRDEYQRRLEDLRR